MADPWITESEIKTMEDMMRNGWDNYDYVEKFEPEFASYHDRKFGIMTPNCTQAIHLLLLALGVKENDEVIAPECTWTATVAPITYTKAKPVFCDITKEDWCLDPDSVKKRITDKTKAIITVDLYGNMGRMEELQEIADEHNIPLIEDSAEALGSKYKGVKAGKFGIGSVFSFHRTKTITTGEGGMLILDDPELYERAMFLRDHGRHPTIPYWTQEATPKYMPSNMQAAIGYAQFKRLDELINKKRHLFLKYKEILTDIPDLQFNIENKDVFNGVWATSLVIGKSHNITKKEIMQKLQDKGLPSRPFFYPLSMLPAYKNFSGNQELNPNSYDISDRGITLPAAYQLTDEQIQTYCNVIKEILKK